MKIVSKYPNTTTMITIILSCIISCSPMLQHSPAKTIEKPSYIIKIDTPKLKAKPISDNAIFKKEWSDLMIKTNRAFDQINNISKGSDEIKAVSLQILKQNVILFESAHHNKVEKDSALNVVKMVILRSDHKMDSMRLENKINFENERIARQQANLEKTVNRSTYSMFDIIISGAFILILIIVSVHLSVYLYRTSTQKHAV